MKRSFALLATSLVTVAALGQTAPPTSYPQDREVTFREMLCGNQGMPPTSAEIPTIGCFGVPSGGVGCFAGSVGVRHSILDVATTSMRGSTSGPITEVQ
jgi:hypothetical protein